MGASVVIRPLAVRIVFLASAAFICYFGTGPVPDVVCADGWHSSSIGIQGACSHHGGVNRVPANFAMLRNTLAVLVSIGLVVAAFRSHRTSGRRATEPSLIHQIQRAIDRQQRVEFMYQKPFESQATRRTVRPIRLATYRHGRRHSQPRLVGFCYLRNAERTFATERMTDVKVLD
jgi:hypothetical protein